MPKETKDLLLAGWEEVHKKSQLTLWILLSLKAAPRSMAEIKDFITNMTKGQLEADDKSMYRALRRFDSADLITSTTKANPSGPDIKIWELTKTGSWVLEKFIKRNITDIFFDSQNKKFFT